MITLPNATRYLFVTDMVVLDGDGHEIAREEWNPEATSMDGYICPRCGAAVRIEAVDDEAPCDCDPDMVDVLEEGQIVECFHCWEVFPATRFIEHLQECLS